MPLQESLSSPEVRDAQGRDSHLTRTRDRIAAFKRQTETAVTPQERQVILDALMILERQLQWPTTARNLRAMDALGQLKEAPQSATSGLAQAFQSLKQEVIALKAQLTGKESSNGDVPEPAPTPQT